MPLGATCVVVGLVGAAGHTPRLRLPVTRVPRTGRRPLVLAAFGVAYAIASLACALPLFLVGVADAFNHRGAGMGVVCGLSYALGMGLVVTAVSLAGAGARQVRLGRIRALQPLLARAAGAALVLVGSYLLLYWITALVDPFASPRAVRIVEGIQNHVSAVLSASPRTAGIVIGAVVVATLAGAGIWGADNGVDDASPSEKHPTSPAVASSGQGGKRP
jgi:cytochrome c-type biogenesis protein